MFHYQRLTLRNYIFIKGDIIFNKTQYNKNMLNSINLRQNLYRIKYLVNIQNTHTHTQLNVAKKCTYICIYLNKKLHEHMKKLLNLLVIT